VSITIEIPQLKNFAKGLQDLPEKVARNILGSALKKAGRLLADRTQSIVPRHSGQLQKSIAGRAKKITEVERAYYVETPLFYAPLIEYGHKWVIKRGNKVIKAGNKGPAPFMRPAFDSTKEEIQNLIATDIGSSVAKQWKKLGNG